MRPDEDDVHTMRQGIVRGIVLATDDSRAVQTATVQTADGVIRAGVEIFQHYGLATNAPAAGADVLLMAIGGDAGDLVGFVTAAGSRFGNQARGETALYNAGGSRVHAQAGGIVEIVAGAKLVILAPEIDVTGNLVVTGNLTVTGNVQVNGAINATGTIHGV